MRGIVYKIIKMHEKEGWQGEPGIYITEVPDFETSLESPYPPNSCSSTFAVLKHPTLGLHLVPKARERFGAHETQTHQSKNLQTQL